MKIRYEAKNFPNYEIQVGIDEAGAGPLMGPVVACALILPDHLENFWSDVRDSKKLSEKNRYRLNSLIREHAKDYSIGYVSEKQIDEINILQARMLAMRRAVVDLGMFNDIDLLLVDGNRFESVFDIPHVTIVKGDDKYLSIAAASIVAKCERDSMVEKLHEKYPMFGWDKNKGYGTSDHIKNIKKYGITKYHRKTFGVCSSAKEFDENLL